MTDVDQFIETFNAAYEAKHKAYEDNFWATKMNLKGCSSSELTRTKADLDNFLGDQDMLKQVQALLSRADLTSEQTATLAIFERTFKCYIVQDPEALSLRDQIGELEAALASERNTMKLGYIDPKTGGFVAASSVQLRNKMGTSPDEDLRKACYEACRTIGAFVAPKFVEIIKLRNKLARKLGFECFYDMKVTQAEGFGKGTLFKMLDSLEQQSLPILEQARARLAREKGQDALKPWNTGFAMSGDIRTKMDPFFPFELAVSAWARSFAALGIKYAGATMRLDLCDRPGKYSNGFCHWPQPAWNSAVRGWVPSAANFTSLATPGQVGSGHTALVTLMHEGGHAAHFANVKQGSPLFSQERAPTSVAYAENQSMFLDSLVGDSAWLGRYALDVNGNVIPWSLVEEKIRSTSPYEVFALRGMLAVPFFERALYDMPEDQLTASRILQLADEIEASVQGGLSGRPLMMVPHILSDESAAYYHGYVLAEMSVHQTRAHFFKTYGRIVDEPRVGADLVSKYWESGNRAMFLDLVKNLTGEELSGDAWVAELKKDLEKHVANEKVEYETAVKEGARYKEGDSVDLDMRVVLVHGDEVIADSNSLSGGLTEACSIFKIWIGNNFKNE